MHPVWHLLVSGKEKCNKTRVDIIKRYLHTLKIEKIGKQKLEFINCTGL